MSWFKVDDSFFGHPKVLRIPRKDRAVAIGLWCLAGSWCAQQLTDGELGEHMVEEFASTLDVANSLVAVGLWDRTGDGYVFHDWQSWQPSRAQVKAGRDAAAKRKQEWRDRKSAGQASPVHVPRPGDESGTRDTSAAVRPCDDEEHSPRPDPTRPDPTVVPKGTTSTARPRKRGSQAPDIFPVTDSMRSWAEAQGVRVNLEAETEQFLDHHRARGSTFRDWRAAWQTWMRNSLTFARSAPADDRSDFLEAWANEPGFSR